jgi:hypothetical protein
MWNKVTKEEAIWYLQPIADSASLPRYAEALNMAIATLREQGVTDINVPNKWISVKDRLPKEDGKYIVCTSRNAVYCARFYEQRTALHPNGSFGTDSRTHITHWMLLPEPPKEV